ncbi:cyanophycin synthetase [Candidatus Magnetomorum sp. HK-1]|nr:cyanophycin synthetase [Candidatus Magnetomorum sp. HK-1]
MIYNERENIMIEAKPHYFHPVRLLIQLYNGGKLTNVRSLNIEPEYGRVGRIFYKDGSVRMFSGVDFGINSHGSSSIAKDKGYAKYFLNSLGYNTPAGKVFLMPNCIKTIDKNLAVYGFKDYSTINDIYSYINSTIGYPCIVKPNNGAKGVGVYKCFNDNNVRSVIEEYNKEYINILIVEKYIDLPAYRIDVFRDEIICCYLRKPLSIIGDGKSTIGELLSNKIDGFIEEGRTISIKSDDPRIYNNLKRKNLNLNTVLSADEDVVIHNCSNLSTGGETENFTEKINPYWKDLCVNLTKDMGLFLCGVDIFCADIENSNAEYYSIHEINASPGLDYSTLGERQKDVVRKFYYNIFNESKIEHVNLSNIIN